MEETTAPRFDPRAVLAVVGLVLVVAVDLDGDGARGRRLVRNAGPGIRRLGR